MLLLYLIAFVAGIVAGISPCILPVLPVVLVASTTALPVLPAVPVAITTGVPVLPVAPLATTTAPALIETEAPATAGPTARRNHRRRAYAVIGGLILSFSVTILFGSEVLSALHLPQDLLRDTGLVVLGLVAAGLLVPALGHLLERPFARLGRRQATTTKGPFVLGLGLGVLFVPCAGPVLAAITVVSANHRVGFSSVVLTADFALGTAVPLLAFALAGQRVAERVGAFRTHVVAARRIGGVALAVMIVVLAFNWTRGLQTAVPGYTSALQRSIEGNSYATRQLSALKGAAEGTAGAKLSACVMGVGTGPSLTRCGSAPAFKGLTAWLNTAGDKPLSLTGLRGKVVLVDFWTYSCINCQRSLPHVEAWYKRYHGAGLEVIGVHTPEFAFEHVLSNVTTATQQLGVHYPVALDNNYKTWDAYDNQGWPADYLIDATGQIRSVANGEGDYRATESLIRALLTAAHPARRLPAPTDVPNRTPVNPLTPETYLGYDRELPNIANTSVLPDKANNYTFPATLPQDYFALGGTWTIGSEASTAGPGARLEFSVEADDVYLVLGGTGTLEVTVDGTHTKTISVSGPPRLYTVLKGAYRSSTLTLDASPGLKAYDFTFG